MKTLELSNDIYDTTATDEEVSQGYYYGRYRYCFPALLIGRSFISRAAAVIMILLISSSWLLLVFYSYGDDDNDDESPHEGKMDNVVAVVGSGGSNAEDEGQQQQQQTIVLIPSTNTSDCANLYECQKDHPDRLGHMFPLYAGQAVCNGGQYRFGLTKQGDLQFHDCSSNKVQVFYNNYSSSSTADDLDTKIAELYFIMTETATLQLIALVDNEDGKSSSEKTELVVWRKESTKCNITPSPQCLHHHPVLDCPYLHLHKSGDLVLNWIDDGNNDKWMARNIMKHNNCYDNLL